jgi:hypothetical protein
MAPRVKMGSKDPSVSRVRLVPLVHKGCVVKRVQQVKQDLPEHKAHKVRWAKQDQPVRADQLDQLELKVRLDQTVRLEKKDLLDL